jgi:hypothetical protein
LSFILLVTSHNLSYFFIRFICRRQKFFPLEELDYILLSTVQYQPSADHMIYFNFLWMPKVFFMFKYPGIVCFNIDHLIEAQGFFMFATFVGQRALYFYPIKTFLENDASKPCINFFFWIVRKMEFAV